MNESLTSWLYRPYIDLTPEAPEGNPQTKGLLLAIDAVENDTDRARIHGLYPGARDEILRQARTAEYALDDPHELPPSLRTSRWEMLCLLLDGMPRPNSDPPSPVRVLWLLHRLHLHKAVLRYAGEEEDEDTMFLRGMARFAVGGETAELEEVARLARPGSWAAIEATYLLAAISAKVRGDAEETERWATDHHSQVSRADGDAHERAKLLSRSHRVRAFVPQFEGDVVRLAREMDYAEEYASRMLRDTEDREAEARTLSFAMWESRSKEALIVGDHGLAEERALNAVAEAPLRPAGHLAVGQALVEQERYEDAIEPFRTAARYGPSDNVGSAPAWFMAGQCFEQVGALDAARDAYFAALDADPLGTASLEQLVGVAGRLDDTVTKRWAEGRLSELGSADPAEPRPYQSLGHPAATR